MFGQCIFFGHNKINLCFHFQNLQINVLKLPESRLLHRHLQKLESPKKDSAGKYNVIIIIIIIITIINIHTLTMLITSYMKIIFLQKMVTKSNTKDLPRKDLFGKECNGPRRSSSCFTEEIIEKRI